MKNRLIELDFIRAMAAISVVGIHITAQYVVTSSLIFYLNNMLSNAVFLFITLSGLVLWYTTKDKEISYFSFVQKKLGKVVFPYIIWTILYVATMNEVWSFGQWNGFNVDTFSKIKDALISGSGFYHLYFIAIIIPLYLIFPLLKKCMLRFPFYTVVATFILWYISAKSMGSLGEILGKVELSSWAFYQPLYWVFYFAVGIYIFQNLEKIKKFVQGKEMLLFIPWVISYIIVTKTSFLETNFPNTVFPIKQFYTVTSFVLYFFFATQLISMSKKSMVVFDFISKHSFFIYFVHPFVIMFYDALAIKYPVMVFHNGLDVAFKFVFVFVASSFVAYVVSFVPFGSFLGGYEQKRVKLKLVYKKKVSVTTENN
jgi:surface polysaccharide O-acyltransferase-like enzyme